MVGAENFLSEINSTVQLLGIEQTLVELKKAREKKIGQNKYEPIITAVFQVFQMNFEDLSKEGKSSEALEKRKLCIAVTIHYLKTNLKLKYNEINRALKLKYSAQCIYQYHNIVKHAKIENPKSPIDKKIAEYISQINKLITNAKN